MALKNPLLRQKLFLAASLSVAPCFISAQTVRDSAGIRIVMNTKPTWTAAQQLRLSAAPSLVIGDREEEPYQFTTVRNPLYLSDGRIVLCEKAANEIRIYDASGKHLKTFGRKGDGPGEFREIASMARLAGDTIAVLHANAMVSRFTSSGAFIGRTREAPGRADFDRSGKMKAVRLALNGGARLLISMPFRPNGPTIGAEFDAKAFHEVIDGIDVSSKRPGELPFMQAVAGKDGADKPWLGAEAVYAANGSQFYFGYGTQYSLTRYSARGVPNLIVRRAWTAPPITRKEFEEFTEEWLKRWSKAKGPELEKERKEQLATEYFKTLPAFSALVLDNVGRAWVRTPKPIDAAVAGSLNDYAIGPSTWSVFSTTGMWLGDVTMPARFSPTDIGADYVLGIARNEDLAPTVVRYTLSTKP